MYLDCDGDSLLYRVSQKKPEVGVCYTGAPTCFSPIITGVFEQKGNTTLTIIPLQPLLIAARLGLKDPGLFVVSYEYAALLSCYALFFTRITRSTTMTARRP